MSESIRLQGRDLAPADIEFIHQLIADNPSWSRRRLSIALCEAWDWRNAKGDIKDMASRSLLVKLGERELVSLPARRQIPTSRMAKRPVVDVAHDTRAIDDPLSALRPLRVINVHRDNDSAPLFHCLLAQYHYLGYTSTVGENMKYLVVDAAGRPLACLLFGSSAWSCSSRDAYIGWDKDTRQRNIHFTTNNTRFLILPWVKVPQLASHVLALISRRIANDWAARYGHGVYLLETFVDQSRFKGTCYRAANWQRVGQTQGRGRNDRYNLHKVPIKSVLVYPLVRHARSKLTAGEP